MIVAKEQIGYKKYRGDDNKIYFCHFHTTGLYDKNNLPIYEIVPLEGYPVADLKKIERTQEEIENTQEFQVIEEQIEKDALCEIAKSDMAQMFDVMRKNALWVEELKTKLNLLMSVHPELGDWKIFEDQLKNLDYIDHSKFVNCKWNDSTKPLQNCIITTNKTKNAIIHTEILDITLKRFNICGIGNIAGVLPDFNYAMMIECYDNQETPAKIQLLDKDDNQVDYVQYTTGEFTLSDEMHFATPQTNFSFKLTIIPKGLDPDGAGPTKHAHLSSWKLIYLEAEPA